LDPPYLSTRDQFARAFQDADKNSDDELDESEFLAMAGKVAKKKAKGR
jgi:hypothetical protein